MLHINKIHQEDHLFAAFSYFDKDGSGYITHDELQEACLQFGYDDTHLEELIREVDQDNVTYISISFAFSYPLLLMKCGYKNVVVFSGWPHRL